MTDLLVDSSYLIALHYPHDTNHRDAVYFEKTNRQPQLIPDVVLPEASHMLKRFIGYHAVPIFLKSVLDSPAQLIAIDKALLGRAYEIMDAYPGSKLDLTDCCIAALAERLNITQILTFDRRDFSIIRPKHTEYFELLP